MTGARPTKPPQITVLITTYNKARELALVLEGFRHQSFRDFELIVADDGSGPETVRVIEEARARTDRTILHSWQENKGFRAARSRNLAIAKASGELIAMTDGDCVPFPNTLETMVRTYKAGCYLAGERLFLTQDEAAAVTPEIIASGRFFEHVPSRERKRLRSVRRMNAVYRFLRLKVRPKVVTCNFVVSRADLAQVNGFDERYVGWGHEDTDLGRRLRRKGIDSANALSEGEVVHLWHPTETSFAGRVRDCSNAPYFERGFFLSRCRKGLSERSYADIKICVRASDAAFAARAAAIIAPEHLQEQRPEVIVDIVRRGDRKRALPKTPHDVAVLVVEQGAMPAGDLLTKTRLVLAQEPERITVKDGMKLALGGESLDEKSLGEVRARLDELL